MRDDETFALLDTSDPAAVLEFERAVFRAFSTTLDDPILKYIWDVDVRAGRIRTKVPYRHQTIHVARLKGAIAAGAAVNLAVNDTMQLEMLGFTIDKAQPRIGEVLVIFNNQRALGAPSISLFETVGLRVIKALKAEHGIERVYSSCPSSKLAGYLQFGWRELSHRDIEGSREHLLEVLI